MFEALRSRLLRALRVPHEPTPPFGAPGSVRVFRAGEKFRRILLLRWGVTQLGAFAGLVFGLYWFSLFHAEFELARRVPAPAATAPATPAASPEKSAPRAKSAMSRVNRVTRELAVRTPDGLFALLVLAEGVGVLAFVAQFFATLVAVRFEYEQHWYIVTDRSLRIRTGLFNVREVTMSFANVQHVAVSQDPLQRLLGLADVRVQSAGGGGEAEGQPGADPSLHHAVFHSVERGPDIRDLILDRLRLFRAAGLGDPDESAPAAPAAATGSAALAAARELLDEAAALRRALAG